MFSKIAVVATLFAVAHAGHEAPQPKAHTYSVPSVAKVSYPAPTITKSVETYSAPSIEKTTTITKTITAPLNAPPVKSIQYSAPAAPVLKAALAPAVYAAPSFAAHGHSHHAAYAHGAHAHAPAAVLSSGYGVQKAVLAGPSYALSIPSAGYSQPLIVAYAPQGISLATTYGSPSIGYSLGSLGLGAVPVGKAVYSSEYGH